MNLCLVSDSHQQRQPLLQATRLVQPLDAVLHAGDEVGDAQWLAGQVACPVYCVAGNWDTAGPDHPWARIVEWSGLRIYLTHGHRLGVKESLTKVVRQARAHAAHVAVFGHTHKACVKRDGKLLLINPGSLSLPRGRREKTFAWLSVHPLAEGRGWHVKVRFFTPEGQVVPELTYDGHIPAVEVRG